jgi:hypothetical protein
MKQIDLQPGRWLVEVREDGGHSSSRVAADDTVSSGLDSHPLPGVNAVFDEIEAVSQARKAKFLAESEDD